MQSAVFWFVLCATWCGVKVVKQTSVVSTSVFEAQHRRADVWNKPLTFVLLFVSAEMIACSSCKKQAGSWLQNGSPWKWLKELNAAGIPAKAGCDRTHQERVC